MEIKTRTRSQFSLAALMGAIIASAVFLGFLANMDLPHVRTSIHCQAIPADDQGLVNWFQMQDYVQNVTASRDENRVDIEFDMRHGTFELHTPPFIELGYTGLRGMESTVSQPSIIGGARTWARKIPTLIWFAVAVVFAALLARQIIASRKPDFSANQPLPNIKDDA